MAAIDLATWDGSSLGGVPAHAFAVRDLVVIQRELNIADAVTAKGSALAQGDTISVLNIPGDFVVVDGHAKKTAAMTGTSTDLTLDIGFTGGDVDVFVDGWDFDAAALNSYATPRGVLIDSGVTTSARTVDILLTTMTGTLTGGKIVVTIAGYNAKKVNRPGIAALQS